MSLLLILVPLACLVVLNLHFKQGFIKGAFWLGLLVILAQLAVVALLPTGLWDMRFNPLECFFHFDASVDAISLVVILAVGLVALATLLCAEHLIKEPKKKFYFVNLLMLVLIGLNGLALAKDLFTMYLFIEIAAIASFILIAFRKDPLGLEGAFKYLLFSALSSVLMLTALSLVILFAGGTSFAAVGPAVAASAGTWPARLALALFVCGALIKSGVVPFHGWLPDVYTAAPTYASVLLAGIITKVSGVYVLIRLFVSVFGFDSRIDAAVMFLGAASILIGALAALTQQNLKRLLAYSSISQVGYIILALGCGTPLAIAGAVFHFFNHAVFKSLLFVNAAAIEQQVETQEIDALGGLSARMPVTGFTSVIGFLSAAGIPPLAGFWSKLMIILALWQAGQSGYALFALLASVLTLAYFLSLQRRVFFGKLVPGLDGVREAGWGITTTAIILALITVGVGVCFPFVMQGLILPIKALVVLP
ncbi:MAG: proton-conducting transporter membrane subunit [Candidatus Margulisiibacteriota bacterium]